MTISLDGIDLPKDLEWQDEFDWSPVSQAQVISMSGALIIEEDAQLKGRPITLYGGPNACWVPRSKVEEIYALIGTANRVMSLNYHGTIYPVSWRHNDKPLEAKPVQRVMNPGAAHKYSITLRLMETA